MAINVLEFDYIRALVGSRSAIALENGKEYLVETRLAPLARQHGISTVSDFIGRLREGLLTHLQTAVVEAMTTNETLFFRDVHPFDALRLRILPDLIRQRAAERRISIWCAACSTGQEPYSIAMLLQEHFPMLQSWKVEILATDLASSILSRAKEARFTQLEVNRGLPAAMLVKYFRQEGTHWHLIPAIRNRVEFRQMNLADAWPWMPPMDLVFLRNVLIYFTAETKKTIFQKMKRVLKPDGLLFLGTAETTLNIDDTYQRIQIEKAIGYRPGSA